jgi:hypothetical protein
MLPKGDPLSSQKSNLLAAAKQLAKVASGLAYEEALFDPVTQATSIREQQEKIRQNIADAKKRKEEAEERERREQERIKREREQSDEDIQRMERLAKLRHDFDSSSDWGDSGEKGGSSHRSSFGSFLGSFGGSSRYGSSGASDKSTTPPLPLPPAPPEAVLEAAPAPAEASAHVENVSKVDRSLVEALKEETAREKFAVAMIESQSEIQKHRELVDAIAKEIVASGKSLSRERLMELIHDHGGFTPEEETALFKGTPGTMDLATQFEVERKMSLPHGLPKIPQAKRVVVEDPTVAAEAHCVANGVLSALGPAEGGGSNNGPVRKILDNLIGIADGAIKNGH